MLPKTHAHHHQQELTGVKGFLHTVEQGLKLYGTLKGVYEVGTQVVAAGRTVAPIIAGML